MLTTSWVEAPCREAHMASSPIAELSRGPSPAAVAWLLFVASLILSHVFDGSRSSLDDGEAVCSELLAAF